VHLTFEGSLVRLEPLSAAHADDLREAAGDRSTFGLASVPLPGEVDAYVERRTSAPDFAPFAQVRVTDGVAVGVTCFLNHRYRAPDDEAPYAVEIGGTWLAASAQRTGINREAKLLLLTHAFETWRCGRVDIKTDARNERARAAIARLGATFEGVLRQWQPSQAAGEAHLLRDTAMYSIVAGEWPAVRARLAAPRSR